MVSRAFLLAGIAACCFVPHAFGGLMDWQIRSDEALPLAPVSADDRIAAEIDMSGFGRVARAYHAELRAMLSPDGSRQLSYEALVSVGAVPGNVTPPKAFGTNVTLGESVPEPASAALVLVGAAMLALRRPASGNRGARG